jgi:hypothetical protein
MSTEAFVPNRTSFAIMKLVHGYFHKTGKSWTLMDQKWMVGKLKEWYGVNICRSTLNYNLAILRSVGIIETVTRHKRDKSGEFVPQKTLYKMTKQLKRFFAGLANYFKRCNWLPSFKHLKMGFVPTVGAATTREQVFVEYQRMRRQGRKP